MEQVKAVESRHVDVAQDHVESTTAADPKECLVTVVHRRDLVLSIERIRDHITNIGIVVDGEDPPHSDDR